MNFGPQQQVFKNLVQADVNDSVLIEELRKPPRQISRSTPKADPVPKLADYLKPLEKIDFDIRLEYSPETFQRPNLSIAKEEVGTLFSLQTLE